MRVCVCLSVYVGLGHYVALIVLTSIFWLIFKTNYNPAPLPASSIAGPLWLLLMTLAEQMRVKLVDIIQLLPANVALPGITLTVATLVQEVECLVGELDATEMACQDLFAIQEQITFLSSRCDGSIAYGRGTVAIVCCIRCTRRRIAATAIRQGTKRSLSSIAIATAAIAAIHHILRHILQFVLQRCCIPRYAIVRLGAYASL